MHWTEKEQIHLLNAIPSYRKEIEQKNLKEAKRVTKDLAEDIHQQCTDVQGRSVEAINQRLAYLDNLLTGVFEEHHYAKKDQHLYSTLPRENNSKVPNLCNTLHHYNGAMKEYRKNKPKLY